MCKPSWADLPKTPQNNKKDTTATTEKSKPKNDKVLFIKLGVMAKITA
jgi:hypothetical protein